MDQGTQSSPDKTGAGEGSHNQHVQSWGSSRGHQETRVEQHRRGGGGQNQRTGNRQQQQRASQAVHGQGQNQMSRPRSAGRGR